jgi:hypothetical protein
MRRIGLAVVLALGLALAALAAGAQQTEKVRRIGFLAGTNRAEPYDALPQGLREHGYVEGQNLRIEWRFAEGKADRIASLTAELVMLWVLRVYLETSRWSGSAGISSTPTKRSQRRFRAGCAQLLAHLTRLEGGVHILRPAHRCRRMVPRG